MVNQVRQLDMLGGLIALDLSWLHVDDFVTVARDVRANVTSDGMLAELRAKNLIDDDDHSVLHYLAARELRRHDEDFTKCLARRTLPDAARQIASSWSALEDGGTVDHRSVADTRIPSVEIIENSLESFRDVVNTVGFPSSVSEQPAADGLPSHRFSRLRPHARGGLGEVSVAWDQELGREVAFKQMQPKYIEDRDSRARFQFEAQLTGRLEHPGIVPVYSAGQDNETGPYYAMRFIKGSSLGQAIGSYHASQGEQSVDARELRRLLNHLINVCHALSYAHSRNVIHRDIKPDNIMIGDFGETFLVDWGLAKTHRAGDSPTHEAVDADMALDSARHAIHTQPGAIGGTPAYMSPEQARGDIEALGPASDIYSLGATLYTLLTGNTAFPTGNTAEMLQRVRTGQFEPPRSVCHEVDPAISAICMKAMALEPADRYGTVDALRTDLENWLADEPVDAWPEPWTVRARRWMNRHRTLVVAASVAVAIATIGLLGIISVQSRANRDLASSNDKLRVARDLASSRADLALAAIEKLPGAVNDNLDVKNRPELAALRDALLQAPKDFYVAFQKQVVESGDTSPATQFRLASVYRNLGDVSSNISSQEGAIESYQAGVEVMDQLLMHDPNRRDYLDLAGWLHSSLAKLYAQHPDLGDAMAEIEYANGIRLQMLDQDPKDVQCLLHLGQLAHALGQIQQKAGRFDNALESAKLSKQHYQQAVESNPDDLSAKFELATIGQLEADILSAQEELSEALTALDRPIEIAQAMVHTSSSNLRYSRWLGNALRQRGDLQRRMGDLDGSRKSAQTSLEVTRQLTVDHPTIQPLQIELAKALKNIAKIDFDAGAIQRAIDASREAIEIFGQIAAQNPANSSYRQSQVGAMMTLGTHLYMAGRKDEAIEAFQDAVPRYEQLVQSMPEDYEIKRSLAGTLYNIGFLLMEVGRFEESLAAYHTALDLRRQLAAAHPDQPVMRNDVAFTLGNIAKLWEHNGDYEEALVFSGEVIDIQRQLVAEHPENAIFLNSLARSLRGQGAVLRTMGQTERALADLRQSLSLQSEVIEISPRRTQSRRDLASAHRGMGNIYTVLGDEAAARGSFETSRQQLEELLADSPEEVVTQYHCALLHSDFANALVEFEDLAAAILSAEQSLEIVNQLLEQNPNDVQFRQVKRSSLGYRAKANTRLGDLSKAKQDLEASIEFATDEDQKQAETALLEARLAIWSGDVVSTAGHVRAVLEETELVATKFAAARILARAASAEEATPKQADEYGQLSVEILKAMDTVESISKQQLTELRYSPSFASLRERDDFPFAVKE